jgi:hypothetical protein
VAAFVSMWSDPAIFGNRWRGEEKLLNNRWRRGLASGCGRCPCGRDPRLTVFLKRAAGPHRCRPADDPIA